MKAPLFHNRIRRVCTLVAATLILPSLSYAQNNQGEELFSNKGLSYLTTITNASGFVARGVLTFHADHTVSAILTGQGQPTVNVEAVNDEGVNIGVVKVTSSFFSSQLGSWKFGGDKGVLVARTIFFDFTNMFIDRLDYTATFASNRTRVTGTITITFFKSFMDDPLNGKPDGVFPLFNFTGTLVTP